MKKSIINLAQKDGNVKEIEADIFKIEGFSEKFAVHECDTVNIESKDILQFYGVTELSTGMAVIKGKSSKQEAKSEAKARMIKHKDRWPEIKEESKLIMQNYGHTYPLND